MRSENSVHYLVNGRIELLFYYTFYIEAFKNTQTKPVNNGT